MRMRTGFEFSAETLIIRLPAIGALMRETMRNILTVLLLCLALPVIGADRPANLQPIPDPPPPPPGFELDPALEPQVTILKRGTDTVEEYRVAGKLYMLKVTPASG